MKKLTATIALTTALGLALTACGEDGGSGRSAAEDFNQADVSFAQEMIPHHQQAVEMAGLAADRARSPEVRRLAAEIEAAQDPEIETMTGWLEDWGADVPADGAAEGDDMGDMGDTDDTDDTDDMEGMDHGSGHDAVSMPGMMSGQDMVRLGRADGARFDRMFLTMMVAHHEGAVQMARTEQADGENSDTVSLAEDVEQAQTAEIASMKDLLAD